MKLRGMDFGHVWDASGVRNFDGSGYPFHKRLRLLFPRGFNFAGSTFVAKTLTTNQRRGNMPLKSDGMTPEESRPKAIFISLWTWLLGSVLNAVGLSNFGIEFALRWSWWKDQTRPFFISWMAVGGSLPERLKEASNFVKSFTQAADRRVSVPAKFGIQLNVSCPNVHVSKGDVVDETHQLLDILSALKMPIVVKISATMDVDTAKRLVDHPYCHAICVSNTIPFGQLPERIPWRLLFGKTSPLLKREGIKQPGGLSGRFLHPIVVDWVKRAKLAGFPRPINAGGGILSKKDALELLYAGADSVSIGSVAILRPWRVAGIIRAVNEFKGMNKMEGAVLDFRSAARKNITRK